MSNISKGYVLGAVASASYGLNPLFTLPLYAGGLDADSVLFWRYGIAILILGIFMLYKKESFKVEKKEIFPLLILGVLIAFSSLFLFLAYNYMDAGIASTIIFVYPVIVSIIMMTFFKEKASFLTFTSIILTFMGVTMLCKNADGTNLNFTGTIYVILSAFSYALYIIGINKSSLKSMSSIKLTFYVLIFGMLIYFIRLQMGINLIIPNSSFMILNVVLLAVFPTIVSLLTMTKAIHYIGSTPTAILGALEPITALFFGIVVFNEQMTLRIFFGVVLILIGVTILIAGKRLFNKKVLTMFINK